jgi:hypothetical protein
MPAAAGYLKHMLGNSWQKTFDYGTKIAYKSMTK